MNLQRCVGRTVLLLLLALGMSMRATMGASPLQDTKPRKAVQKNPDLPNEATPDEDAKLPSADDVLKRHIEAVGGERAIKGHKFQTRTGTFEFVGTGLTGTLNVRQAAPNLLLVTLENPQIGEIRQGFNGEVGWVLEPNQGPQILEGDMLADVKKDADFYADLNYAERFPQRETLSKEEFDDIMCYRLKLTTNTGSTYEAFYAVDSGLYAGHKGDVPTPQGKMAAIATAKDYKTVDGVKIPHTITTTFPDFRFAQVFKFETISHEAFDKEVFDLPREVQTLLEIKQEEAAKAGDDDADDDDDDDDEEDDD